MRTSDFILSTFLSLQSSNHVCCVLTTKRFSDFLFKENPCVWIFCFCLSVNFYLCKSLSRTSTAFIQTSEKSLWLLKTLSSQKSLGCLDKTPPNRLLFEFPVLICRLQVWSTKLAKPLFFHQLFVLQIDKCETASKSPPGIILNLQAKPSLVEILGWICGQQSKLLVCAEIGLPMCRNSTMIIITCDWRKDGERGDLNENVLYFV